MRRQIICDKCKSEISKCEIKNRIITQDKKGIDVKESYFQCPTCGKKYTVLLSDRKLRLLIRKRVLCLKKIQKAKNKNDEVTVLRCSKKYDKIKKEISDRQEVLVHEYGDICQKKWSIVNSHWEKII